MKLVGIDLGTTNSAIAYINEFGKAEILPNKEGERITPSVVLLDGDQIIVGTIAKQSSVADPENTISSIKSQMGNSDFIFVHEDKEFSPEDISAMILRKLIDDAEEYLEEKITDIVVTVPAYFNDKQRKATIDSGEIAGVNVLQIINEPTAAALTFGLGKDVEKTIMVYDLGGGTFDVTIMKLRKGEFSVVASDGDRALGGNNFDDKLMNYLNSRFEDEHGINLLEDPVLAQDLRLKSENAKKTLSSKKTTNIYLSAQGKSSKIEITREKLSELVDELITRTELLLEAVLMDADMAWSDIDQILMVGGSTRMPAVLDRIKKITKLEPTVSINPDEAVALGAAIQAGIVSSKDKKSDISDMVRMKYGSIKVADVTAHSFGAVSLDESNKKRNAIIIPKNSKIPIRKSQMFYTTVPNQISVTLTVLQGEDPDPEFCTVIGKTKLEFPPKPMNSPVIFNYEYDVNGIIHATAKDPETGQKSVIKIERIGELSGEEVRMKAENLSNILPKKPEFQRRDYVKQDESAESDADFKDEDTKDDSIKTVTEIFELSGSLLTDEEEEHNKTDEKTETGFMDDIDEELEIRKSISKPSEDKKKEEIKPKEIQDEDTSSFISKSYFDDDDGDFLGSDSGEEKIEEAEESKKEPDLEEKIFGKNGTSEEKEEDISKDKLKKLKKLDRLLKKEKTVKKDDTTDEKIDSGIMDWLTEDE